MWRDLLNLKGGAASIQEINQRILADATVSGTNLIVLVMAIMIACVGLNMNSVAVITIAPLGLITRFNCSHIGSSGMIESHLQAVVP